MSVETATSPAPSIEVAPACRLGPMPAHWTSLAAAFVRQARERSARRRWSIAPVFP